MIKAVLIFIFLLLPTHSMAECEDTISPDDKIGDVKKKLACLSAENFDLKREIQKLRESSSTSNAPRIHTYGKNIDLTKLTPEICKNRAITSIIKRGGQVVEQGANWVDVKLGKNGIMIDCNAKETAYVIVSGDDHGAIQDLAKLLGEEIFR